MPRILLFVTFVVLACSIAVMAQDSPPSSRPVEKKADARIESPFQPDESLRRLLGGKETRPDEFRQLERRPLLPAMSLRGLIRMKGRAGYSGLVEIDGVGRYTVRSGDRLAFTVAARPSLTATSAPGSTAAPRGATNPEARVIVGANGQADQPRFESLPLVLKVVEVGRNGVVVEVGTVGEVVIIR